MYLTDHNDILHTSRQCSCRDVLTSWPLTSQHHLAFAYPNVHPLHGNNGLSFNLAYLNWPTKPQLARVHDKISARIRKRYRETGRWQRLPGSGRSKKTTACEERYLRRLVKRMLFRSLALVTQGFGTHLGYPVSKRTVQRRLHGRAIYSRVAVQKTDISLENQLLRRWRILNFTVPENWPSLIFSDESRFNLTYCDGRVRVWWTAGKNYTRMSTHGQ